MINLEKQIQLIGSTLSRFALKLTRNETDAKDLYQDTLIRIFMNKDRFEPGSNFKAWAVTIMRNIFINEFRKKVRRRNILNDKSNHAYINGNTKTFNNGESNLISEDLCEIIDALPENFRTPFLMVFQGYKYEEISEIIGLPLGTVKSRVFFARKKLIRMYNSTEKQLSRA